jgi:hypothetical protein
MGCSLYENTKGTGRVHATTPSSWALSKKVDAWATLPSVPLENNEEHAMPI